MIKQASGYICIDVPVRMSLRNYLLARAAFYRETKFARDDAALPLSVNGIQTVRKITGMHIGGVTELLAEGDWYLHDAPAEDWLLDAARVAPGAEPREMYQPPSVEPTAADWDAYLHNPRLPRPATRIPPPVARPAFSRFITKVATPNFGNRTAGDYRATRAQIAKPIHYPQAPRADLVGAWSIELPEARRNEHGTALVSAFSLAANSDWLSDSLANQPMVFAAPAVESFFGWNKDFTFATVEFDTPRTVLILDPHPFIPSDALPPAVGPNVPIPLYGGTVIKWFRPVSTKFAILSGGKRVELRATPAGYIGWYTEAESGNFINKLMNTGGIAGDFYRGVARSAAVEAVLTVAAGVISAGAGAPIVQSALAAARGANLDRFIDQAYIIAPDAARVMEIANPQMTNDALAEIAKGTQYLAGFDSFYGTVFRELAIMAQSSQAASDKLRIRLAILQSEIAAFGGSALAIGKMVFEAVKAIILTIGTAGFGTAVEATAQAAAQAAIESTALQFLDIAQQVAQKINDLLVARNMMELQRIMMDRIKAKHQAQIDCFVSQLPTGADASVSSGYVPERSEAGSGASRGAIPDSPAAPIDSGERFNPAALFANLVLRPIARGWELYRHGF